MRSFDIIAAVDQELGLGKNGSIPWHLPADLEHFRELTCKCKSPTNRNAVIMGRKTWESLPEKFQPLPERLNIILTRKKDFLLPDGVIGSSSLDQALKLLDDEPNQCNVESVFVIGGGEVFKEAINNPGCQRLYLTHILAKFDCDIFLPSYQSLFKLSSSLPPIRDSDVTYYFAAYCRSS